MILGPDSSEPLTFALALSALSWAFRRASWTSIAPRIGESDGYWTTSSWKKSRDFTSEKKCFFLKFLVTPKSRVFHALSRWNHGFFTHYSRWNHAWWFFPKISNFRIWVWKSQFLRHTRYRNCIWIETPWPFPTPRLRNLQGKKGHTCQWQSHLWCVPWEVPDWRATNCTAQTSSGQSPGPAPKSGNDIWGIWS